MNLHKNTDQYHLIVAIFAIVSFVIFGTFIFHVLEGWDFAESFYFSVATLATVGYGDLHPTSDLSRIVAAFYILFGAGTTVAAVTVIATDRINKTAGRIRNYAVFKKDKKDDNLD